MEETITIEEATQRFLAQTFRSKSQATGHTYRYGLQRFLTDLAEHGVDPDATPVTSLDPAWMEWLLESTAHLSVACEQTYCSAVTAFYRYVVAQEWAVVNLERLRYFREQRRKTGQRLPVLPEQAIERLIELAEKLLANPGEKDPQRLIALRDGALVLTLADTGLRVSEVVELRRGDIQWDEARAVILGKGDKQAIVHFSSRAMSSIRQYHSARSALDTATGRPAATLPVFAGHGGRAGNKLPALSTRRVEQIVEGLVAQVGEEYRGQITPHTLRHYFVTRATRKEPIAVVKEMARHANIATTAHYTHLHAGEVAEAYRRVFNSEAHN
jgi:integrase/recombinase XerC